MRPTLALALLGLCLLAACGDGSSESAGDAAARQAREVREAIAGLPYSFHFRHVKPPGRAKSVIAGRAVSKDGAGLDFSITIGAPVAVPVPRTGTKGVIGPFGDPPDIIYNDNTAARFPGDTPRTVQERSNIAVKITDSLCEKFTGKPCPA